jgi:hypothetical protein
VDALHHDTLVCLHCLQQAYQARIVREMSVQRVKIRVWRGAPCTLAKPTHRKAGMCIAVLRSLCETAAVNSARSANSSSAMPVAPRAVPQTAVTAPPLLPDPFPLLHTLLR